MGSRDHSIECDRCGESYGGFNGPDEHVCCDTNAGGCACGDLHVAGFLEPTEILSPSEICHLRTWCIKPTHPPDEPCLEKPRKAMPASDFGPEQAKRRRY